MDVEVKVRSEATRLKKKMESDVNELEVQVDQLNKNNTELMKTVKKMQQQIKVRSCLNSERQNNNKKIQKHAFKRSYKLISILLREISI